MDRSDAAQLLKYLVLILLISMEDFTQVLGEELARQIYHTPINPTSYNLKFDDEIFRDEDLDNAIHFIDYNNSQENSPTPSSPSLPDDDEQVNHEPIEDFTYQLANELFLKVERTMHFYTVTLICFGVPHTEIRNVDEKYAEKIQQYYSYDAPERLARYFLLEWGKQSLLANEIGGVIYANLPDKKPGVISGSEGTYAALEKMPTISKETGPTVFTNKLPSTSKAILKTMPQPIKIQTLSTFHSEPNNTTIESFNIPLADVFILKVEKDNSPDNPHYTVKLDCFGDTLALIKDVDQKYVEHIQMHQESPLNLVRFLFSWAKAKEGAHEMGGIIAANLNITLDEIMAATNDGFPTYQF